MSPSWLSNTYLVVDEPVVGDAGATAVMIDAGGPVAPLLDELSRRRCRLSHVLLTHHHHDHLAELDQVIGAHPDAQVLIHPLERDSLERFAAPGVTGELLPGPR